MPNTCDIRCDYRCFGLSSKRPSIYGKQHRKAIAKGIDPISVRCSYTRGDYPICIAFAATKSDPVLQSIPVKK